MPLMMDDDMSLDDLFGDGAGLSMPARPPTKELIQKVDEMRKGACNRKIVWSKTGLVASISSSGFNLELRNLRCNPENGSWDLSQPTVIPHLNGNIEGGPVLPLQHLCFSPNGTELAIVDVVGRVSVIQIFNSLNKPQMMRPAVKDQIDDLHALAGCHWLNTAQRHSMMVHKPAVREKDNKFKYENVQVPSPPNGPSHPIPSQSAFMCLTINGVLRLLFPQTQPKPGNWHEARVELESIVSSDDMISHAAFCNEKNGTLLLAYASTNKQLRLVRVSIDWGSPTELLRQGPPPILNPKIEVEHLVVGSWMASEAEEDINSNFSMGNSSLAKSSMVYLSYLDILPPIVEPTGEVSTPPTILAIRSHLPPSSTNYNQEVHSTLDRWSFQESTQSLHSAFERYSLRRNSTGSLANNTYRQLKAMTCLTVDKIILSIQHFNFAKTLCITYSDGSIEYRDRATLAETSQHSSDSPQTLNHLTEAGFAYTNDEPCVHAAMSPTLCSAVQIDSDGKLRWKRLEYHFTDMAPADLQRNAANAAFTVCCANSLHSTATIDDLLDVVFRNRGSPNLSFQGDLPPELTSILNLRVDYSTEQHYDALVRNHFLHAVLGFQNSLGYSGDLKPRSFSGKFSWIALHIRHVVVIATMAQQFKAQTPDGKAEPLLDPDIVNALAGMLEWSLNLMAWIVDTLLELRDIIYSCAYDLNALNKTLSDTLIPSLHLLLSSTTRGFLISLCRRVVYLDWLARKAISAAQIADTPPLLRESYNTIATLTSASLVKYQHFETLLTTIDTSVKEAYASAHIADTPNPTIARNNMETKLLLCFPIPPIFKNVVEKLFQESLPAILGTLPDMDLLYFAGYGTRIGLNAEGVAMEPGVVMDGFYKKWIRGIGQGGGDANRNVGGAGPPGIMTWNGQPMRVKRCMRCCSCMEDKLVSRVSNHWMIQQQRRCICGGYWNLLTPGRRYA